MSNLQDKIHQLAFKADRKILDFEDEDYLRLDLLAHEKSSLSYPRPFENSFFAIKKFAFSALAIFAFIFFASNAPAYAKIAMVNFNQSKIENLIAINPMDKMILKNDPWIGSHSVENVSVELAGEDQILSTKSDLLLAPMPTSIEDRIYIPSLNINAPLIQPKISASSIQTSDWNEIENQIRTSLLEGIVHYPGTADPGKKGNFFVTGHSSNVFWDQSTFNTVFALLPKIEVGSEIIVTKNQKEYVYIVSEKREVSPKEVSILKQGDEHEMTLMTCTPIGTTLKRLVVKAELKL